AEALQSRAKLQVLGHAELAVERATLRHVPDPPADGDRVGEDIEPGDAGAAAGGGEVAGQDAHGGGLAGPVGAEKPDDAALGDHERHAADGRVFAVILGELLDDNHAEPVSGGKPGRGSLADT